MKTNFQFQKRQRELEKKKKKEEKALKKAAGGDVTDESQEGTGEESADSLPADGAVQAPDANGGNAAQ